MKPLHVLLLLIICQGGYLCQNATVTRSADVTTTSPVSTATPDGGGVYVGLVPKGEPAPAPPNSCSADSPPSMISGFSKCVPQIDMIVLFAAMTGIWFGFCFIGALNALLHKQHRILLHRLLALLFVLKFFEKLGKFLLAHFYAQVDPVSDKPALLFSAVALLLVQAYEMVLLILISKGFGITEKYPSRRQILAAIFWGVLYALYYADIAVFLSVDISIAFIFNLYIVLMINRSISHLEMKISSWAIFLHSWSLRAYSLNGTGASHDLMEPFKGKLRMLLIFRISFSIWFLAQFFINFLPYGVYTLLVTMESLELGLFTCILFAFTLPKHTIYELRSDGRTAPRNTNPVLILQRRIASIFPESGTREEQMMEMRPVISTQTPLSLNLKRKIIRLPRHDNKSEVKLMTEI